jgi:hypothetical protein
MKMMLSCCVVIHTPQSKEHVMHPSLVEIQHLRNLINEKVLSFQEIILHLVPLYFQVYKFPILEIQNVTFVTVIRQYEAVI